MDTLIPKLIKHYETVLQSSSDSLFYKNVHTYIDYIVKTPTLSAVINKSEEEYNREHRKIWGDKKTTDYEIDYQSALTNRLESLSLFATHYSLLFGRIYQPIEEYFHPTPSLADKLDPVALLMLNGFKKTEKTGLWRHELLKTYNRWFDGERNYYEEELKQFHTDFLIELEKLETIKEETLLEPQKLKITFDTENSILKINDIGVKITLKNDKTDGHYVLEYLFEQGIENPADYVDILKVKFKGDKKNNMSMYRACNDINRKVSEQANISNFLDIHSGKTGWVQVNKEFR